MENSLSAFCLCSNWNITQYFFFSNRHIFLSILRAAASEIYSSISNKICEPLEATGMPPFLMITADKATINRRTNQTILAASAITGERTFLPVGSPLVYDGEEGGTAAELASQICDTLLKNYCLPESHLQMIAGKVNVGSSFG